ncbi:MAG: von Willebrand factor type A domain-containing protein [Lachnospiraceae bacterium]|nr:von Willebrand factor type A domain-containing protein [Lachnospiraceae bacterium]
MKKHFGSLSKILAFSLIVTVLLTGCSSEEASRDTYTSTSTDVYNNSPAMTDMKDTSKYEFTEEDGDSSFSYAYMENMTSPPDPVEEFNTEEYNDIKESSFKQVTISPLSTFAADVDTGSLTNLRRLLTDYGRFIDVPSGAVRTEELINYFDYTAGNKIDGEKFSLRTELHPCPWNEENGLLMMTVTANEEDMDYVGSNFVFLVDTSGSMYPADKLDLAIEGFKLLTDSLTEKDRVSIVTYSGSSEVLLSGCKGDDHSTIKTYLEKLSASGGTNGSGGITAAYECALENFISGGNNRVIIASDGDMNLGITSNSGLTDLIREKKESGIFLTVLGFGSGNYSDANMESIADAGNGNYYYIDCLKEAQRVLVDKLKSTTVTVAKDVKFQIEFNPAVVSEYRQIGYENRQMAAEDFNDDKKDGGEVGAGTQVTAFYEIKFASGDTTGEIDLKYQENKLKEGTPENEMLTLSVRYKEPAEDTSVLEKHAVLSDMTDSVTPDYAWASGLIELSMNIRGSEYIGTSTYQTAIELMSMGAETRDSARIDFRDLIVRVAASSRPDERGQN